MGEDQKNIYIRVKIGMVEILDKEQQYSPDIDLLFYFEPSADELESIRCVNKKLRYKNLHTLDDGTWPFWTPHFDFNAEVGEALVTDESYWIKDGIVYGRKNIIPKLQKRMDQTTFPYDRQILDIELLSNNCHFKPWEKGNDCPKELKLNCDQWHIQGTLQSVADSWDLDRVRMKIERDRNEASSKASIFVYIHREHEYYTLNISVMIFIITFLQAWLPNFAYDESRYNFTLTLVLTQVTFRFVVQGLVPQLSYLMHLDKYILAGYSVLFVRFVLDFWLVTLNNVPLLDENFRCGPHLSTFLSSPGDLPTICLHDFQLTTALAAIWILGTIIFLILPAYMWRTSWNRLEKALEHEKTFDTLFFENGSLVSRSSKVPLAQWLGQHGQNHDEERFPTMLMGDSKNANSRGCKELRGWRIPNAGDERFSLLKAAKMDRSVVTDEESFETDVDSSVVFTV